MLENEKEWYWDWIKHEGNVFNARGNFFLIAQSMLLIVVATLSNSYESQLTLVLCTCFCGLFITIIWLYVNAKHRKTQGLIVGEFEKIFRPYKLIKRKTRLCPWSIPNHIMIGFILPFGLLVLWTILLFIYGQ